MHRKTIFRRVLLLGMAVMPATVLLVTHPPQLKAQLAGQGQITGRVTDSTGAVVPLATVTITNVGSGVKMVRSTSNSGIYLASPLIPGVYRISVEAPGFKTAVQDNITVNGTESVGLDIKLQVGTEAQTVTVSAAPPMIDKTDATLGATMENKAYEALPILINNGQRDPTAFSFLMPGVQGGARSGVLSGQGGSASRVVQNYIDGIPATPPSQTDDNRTVQLGMPMDAVDQFSVVTSGASAQYQGLGSESYTVKSGTSALHGQVQAFVRNTAFDAWDYFAKGQTTNAVVNGVATKVPAPKPSEHQDELDFSAGGPIYIPHIVNGRDKLFFFGSYTKYHQTTGVNPSFVSVPTTLERQGNFTELNYPIYDPSTLTQCTNANGGKPCVYQFDGAWNGVATPNVIPANEISPQAQYMEKFMPTPTIGGTQNNLLTGEPQGLDNWALADKVDYHPNQNHDISIMNTSGIRNFLGFDGASGPPAPYNRGFYVKEIFSTTVLNDTWILTPHLVNSLSWGYIRGWGFVHNPWIGIAQYNPVSAVGIGNLQPGQMSEAFPAVGFSSFADQPTSWGSMNSYTQVTNTYDLVDNLQWTKGKHNITFGFVLQWRNENQDNWDSPTKPLGLNFNGVNTAGYTNGVINNTTSGNAYASFMLGAVNSTGFAVQPFTTLGARYKGISPMFGDDWRVSPSLTLNLGARWDINTPYREKKNRWAFMNPLLTNPITGNLGAIEYAGYGPYSCGCVNPYGTYLGNFEPRIGFAYTVKQKTVVRGAFSVMSSLGGGVGGAGNAYNGAGQFGMVGSVNYPSSGQSGAIPAFYLNNSTQFQNAGTANTALPGFTPTNNPSQNITPGVNTGNYVINGTGVNPQGVADLDSESANRSPYSETWNIGVERAIFPNTVVSVNYVGSESHFLYGSNNGYLRNELNPQYEVLGSLLKQLPTGIDKNTGQTFLSEAQAIVPTVSIPYANFGGPNGTIQSTLSPFPQYGGVSDVFEVTGTAAYSGMQFVLTQRTWRGLNFQLNYTYSREKDSSACCRTGYDIPGSAITDGIARQQEALDYSEHEPRQILHTFGTYDLPFGRGHIGGNNPLVNIIAGGWQTSGIFTYSSGQILGFKASGCIVVGQGCNPSFTPGYTKNVRINGSYGHGINNLTSATTPFLDATAFYVPNKTYQVGNVPATGGFNVFGPSRWEVDGGINRTFKITQYLAFVFAAQVQNLTNHFSWGAPNTTINQLSAVAPGGPTNGNGIGTNAKSNFGTLTNSGQLPRDWQFNAKFVF